METGVSVVGRIAVVSAVSGVEDVAVLSGVSTTGRTAVAIVCACPGDMYHRHRHVHIIVYFSYIIMFCIRYIVLPLFYAILFFTNRLCHLEPIMPFSYSFHSSMGVAAGCCTGMAGGLAVSALLVWISVPDAASADEVVVGASPVPMSCSPVVAPPFSASPGIAGCAACWGLRTSPNRSISCGIVPDRL